MSMSESPGNWKEKTTVPNFPFSGLPDHPETLAGDAF